MSPTAIEARLADVADQAEASRVERASKLRERARAFALDPGQDSLDDLSEDDLKALRAEAEKFLRGREALAAARRLSTVEAELEELQARDRARAAEIGSAIAALEAERRTLGGEAGAKAREVAKLQAAAGELTRCLGDAERAWEATRQRSLEAARARARNAARELESRPGKIAKLKLAIAEVTGLLKRVNRSDGESWLAGLKRREGTLNAELTALEGSDNAELRAVIRDSEAEVSRLEAELAEHQRDLSAWFGLE